jgi:hypothetical protein
MSQSALLRSYLLRTLAEDQREAVDRRLLEDDGFFELALALESDLLADYAAGELTASEAAVVRGGWRPRQKCGRGWR